MISIVDWKSSLPPASSPVPAVYGWEDRPLVLPSGFEDLLSALKDQVRTARLMALRTVN